MVVAALMVMTGEFGESLIDAEVAAICVENKGKASKHGWEKKFLLEIF